MIDAFAKTLVIEDPDYAPGVINPPRPTASSRVGDSADRATPARESQQDVADDNESPSFDDTSWLT